MKRRRPRSGAALMLTVVALAVLSILLTSILVQSAATRRTVSRIENQRQAEWLARAGIEIGLQKALAEPDKKYAETVRLLPEAEVRVEVLGDKERIRISCNASYPAGTTDVITRTVARSYRKIGEGGKMRLESEPLEEQETP